MWCGPCSATTPSTTTGTWLRRRWEVISKITSRRLRALWISTPSASATSKRSARFFSWSTVCSTGFSFFFAAGASDSVSAASAASSRSAGKALKSKVTTSVCGDCMCAGRRKPRGWPPWCCGWPPPSPPPPCSRSRKCFHFLKRFLCWCWCCCCGGCCCLSGGPIVSAMGESVGARIEVREVAEDFGFQFLEGAAIADHEVRTRAFLFERQLLGFAACHLPGFPAPARGGSPRARLGVGIHEEELVALLGQAVGGLVLEEQGDVEHDARYAPRTGPFQEPAYPGTDPGVGKGLEPGALGGAREDPPGELLPIGQSVGAQDGRP